MVQQGREPEREATSDPMHAASVCRLGRQTLAAADALPPSGDGGYGGWWCLRLQ